MIKKRNHILMSVTCELLSIDPDAWWLTSHHWCCYTNAVCVSLIAISGFSVNMWYEFTVSVLMINATDCVYDDSDDMCLTKTAAVAAVSFKLKSERVICVDMKWKVCVLL